MKLFIDDVRTPRDNSGEWIIARTNTEAFNAIINSPEAFEEIHIDHDIAGIPPIEGTSPETFMPVIHFLVHLEHRDVAKKIIIHTWNITKAEEMAQMLRNEFYNVTVKAF